MKRYRQYIARPTTTVQAGWEVLHPDDDNPEALCYVARCEEREAVIIAKALNAAKLEIITR